MRVAIRIACLRGRWCNRSATVSVWYGGPGFGCRKTVSVSVPYRDRPDSRGLRVAGL